jgi:hypothetical protein
MRIEKELCMYVCMYLGRRKERDLARGCINEMDPDRMQKMFEWYAQILIPMCFVEADCHLGYIMARL